MRVVRFPHSNRLRRAFQGFLCLCLVLVLQRSPVAAQNPPVNQALITQVLDSPQVFIQNKQAKLNDSARKGQRVRTGQARAQLTFNTGAVGRLAHNSVLMVGQCARLQRGTLLVNGAMNGCTSSIVAGVRGTTYVLEVDEADNAQLNVVEGEVTVTRSIEANEEDTAPASGTKQFPIWRSIPLPIPLPAERSTLPQDAPHDQTTAAQIILKAGERVSITPTGKIGLIEKLTQAEFTSLLKGNLFNGYATPLPGIAKIQQSFQNLFPGVPFPLSLPRVPPVPVPPVRLPFPF